MNQYLQKLEQFSQYLPENKLFHYKYDGIPFIKDRFPWVLIITFCYVTSVWWYNIYISANTHLQKTPRHFLLTNAERVWNLIAAVMSGLGFYLSATDPLYMNKMGLNTNWTGTGAWVLFLYVATKPMEYIDTLFIMLKHKPVRRLHWFHHAFTTVYSWWCARLAFRPSIMFGVINMFVHAVMYTYYLLVSFSVFRSFLKRFSFIVTYIQMLQFIVCLISVVVFYDYYKSAGLLLVTVCMYIGYFVMFFNMYRSRYRNTYKVKTK